MQSSNELENIGLTLNEESNDINLNTSPRFVFIIPFPEFENEDEFNNYIHLMDLPKGDGLAVFADANGFTMLCELEDEEKGLHSFSSYQGIFNGIKAQLEPHQQTAINSFKKRGVELKIETYSFPKTDKEKELLKSKLETLTSEDYLFLSAHGSIQTIGIRPLHMEAPEIVEFISGIGISKIDPPHFIIGACHSGSIDKDCLAQSVPQIETFSTPVTKENMPKFRQRGSVFSNIINDHPQREKHTEKKVNVQPKILFEPSPVKNNNNTEEVLPISSNNPKLV